MAFWRKRWLTLQIWKAQKASNMQKLIQDPVCTISVEDIKKTFEVWRWDDNSLTVFWKLKNHLKPAGHHNRKTRVMFQKVPVSTYALVWVLVYGEHPKGQVRLKGHKLRLENITCDVEPPFTFDVSTLKLID